MDQQAPLVQGANQYVCTANVDKPEERVSECETAYASASDKDLAESVLGSVDASVNMDGYESDAEDLLAPNKCPVSGNSLDDVLQHSPRTCPFMAMLMCSGAKGRSSLLKPLLEPLKLGSISLVDPMAESNSAEFGVLSI